MNIESLRPILEVLFAWPILATFLFLAAGLAVGIIAYRVVMAMAAGLPGWKPRDEGKWSRLVDVGICVVCVPYIVLYWCGYLYTISTGKLSDPVCWNVFVAHRSLSHISGIGALGAILIPVGFAVMSILDFRRLPLWLKVLPIASVLYIALRLWDVRRRIIWQSDPTLFKPESLISTGVLYAICVLICVAILYMLYRAFKPIYRKRKMIEGASNKTRIEVH